jgi:hypothetical protein
MLKQQQLTNNAPVVLPHLPHSPCLAPCNIYLFPLMNGQLKNAARVQVTLKITCRILHIVASGNALNN